MADRALPLIWGGAQLGMPYGILGEGRPSIADMREMADLFLSAGGEVIDAAAAYGDSLETILEIAKARGAPLRVGMKLMPGVGLQTHREFSQTLDKTRRFFNLNKQHLSLAYLMFHRLDDMRDTTLGAVFTMLDEYPGVPLGVSLLRPSELKDAASFPEIKVVQAPINLADHRWQAVLENDALLEQLQRWEFHARSVFLQGLLLTDDETLWERAGASQEARANVLNWLRQQMHALGFASVQALLIAGVLSLPFVDQLVMGMNSSRQMRDNLKLVSAQMGSSKSYQEFLGGRPILSRNTLDPAMWSAL